MTAPPEAVSKDTYFVADVNGARALVTRSGVFMLGAAQSTLSLRRRSSHQLTRWSEQQRARELRGLLDGIQAQLVREQHAFAFHVLAVDFNALAPGERFDPSPMPAWIRGMIWLSGREIGRHTIEMMRADGYVDSWCTIHPDSEREPGFTFPVWSPHVRLDYVFTPISFASRVLACEVRRTPEFVRKASDHFPVLVELAER